MSLAPRRGKALRTTDDDDPPGTTMGHEDILNHLRAIAANVYLLLYPSPTLARVLTQDPSLAWGCGSG